MRILNNASPIHTAHLTRPFFPVRIKKKVLWLARLTEGEVQSQSEVALKNLLVMHSTDALNLELNKGLVIILQVANG